MTVVLILFITLLIFVLGICLKYYLFNRKNLSRRIDEGIRNQKQPSNSQPLVPQINNQPVNPQPVVQQPVIQPSVLQKVIIPRLPQITTSNETSSIDILSIEEVILV
jgi:hypothetical protein